MHESSVVGLTSSMASLLMKKWVIAGIALLALAAVAWVGQTLQRSQVMCAHGIQVSQSITEHESRFVISLVVRPGPADTISIVDVPTFPMVLLCTRQRRAQLNPIAPSIS